MPFEYPGQFLELLEYSADVTQGAEEGMLEDFFAAVKALRLVEFAFTTEDVEESSDSSDVSSVSSSNSSDDEEELDLNAQFMLPPRRMSLVEIRKSFAAVFDGVMFVFNVYTYLLAFT